MEIAVPYYRTSFFSLNVSSGLRIMQGEGPSKELLKTVAQVTAISCNKPMPFYQKKPVDPGSSLMMTHPLMF